MKSLSILLCCSVLSACASPGQQEVARADAPRVEYSAINPDADFSNYRGLLFVPLEILNADQSPLASSQDLTELRLEFRKAFITALNNDYMILSRPARDVLRIRGQLVKTIPGSAKREPGAGLSFSELTSGGDLIFSMQLENSFTGEVLARASDRSSLGAARTASDRAASIIGAANYWAGLFRDFLDKNVPDARRR